MSYDQASGIFLIQYIVSKGVIVSIKNG